MTNSADPDQLASLTSLAREGLTFTMQKQIVGINFEITVCIQPLTLNMLRKMSAEDIKKIYFFFLQKTGFDISYKLYLETVCMKRQSLFSGKKIELIMNFSSAQFAHIVVRVTSFMSHLRTKT